MVTIIITAYNVSATISKAIQSCLNQTYGDLEILVINDCSTDNTLEIINSFNDSRIKVINNTENVGAGMSRRIGTKAATGDYTIFLDGDDYIDADCIETLYSLGVQNNADVVSGGLRVIDGDSIRPHLHTDNKVVHKADILKEIIKEDNLVGVYLNAKLIRRSMWDVVEYSPRRYVEDTQTCFYVLHNTNILVMTKYCGYNYIQNPKSLCHQADEIKNKIYCALCAKDVLQYVKKYNNQEYKHALTAFFIRLEQVKAINLTEDIRLQYKDELSELFVTMLENVQFNR